MPLVCIGHSDQFTEAWFQDPWILFTSIIIEGDINTETHPDRGAGFKSVLSLQWQAQEHANTEGIKFHHQFKEVGSTVVEPTHYTHTLPE